MTDILNLIVQLISNVGFPIACVIAMFYMWNKEREAHHEEAQSWATALHNNTEVLQEIKTILNGGFKHDD